MSKVRVYEVAKQLNMDQKTLVALFQSIGVGDVRNHMSSVETDAVERLKRHLERQKSPEVVEERIRPTVVKRRARPTDDVSPSPAVRAPAAAASQPGARPSSVGVPPPPSSLGNATAPAISVPTPAPSAAPSVRGHVAEPAPSAPSHEPEPAVAAPVAEAPASRATPSRGRSSRAAAKKAGGPSVSELDFDADASPAASAERVVVEPAPVVAPAVVAPAAVASAVVAPEPIVEPVAITPPTMPAPEPVVEAAPEPQPAPPAAAPEPEPPPSVEPAPVSAPPVSAPVAASPRAETPAPPPVTEAPRRPSSPPRTGIDVWQGRPGVPMPQTRQTSPPARRTTYDPRAAAQSARPGGPGAYGGPGMRPGGGGRPGQQRFGGPGRPGQRNIGPSRPKGPQMPQTEMAAHKKVIKIEETVSLQKLAAMMSLKVTDVLFKLLGMGMPGVNINSTIDADTAKILAGEFGWTVEDVAVSEEASIEAAMGLDDATEAEFVPRPPIVTVMGHVDHGKTSLLDRIRKASVAAGEAGGITQHIGAYRVETAKGTVAFLDTPGHEAFTAMRARGAQVTDLVILVVAADDGVMPQTKEAISHSQSAKVPIIVAINKIDKPSADPEKIKRDLSALGLQPEEWGGDTLFCNVSALTGQGVEALLESVALQAEVLELKAAPKRRATGVVVEALLDRGRGPVARVMVQDGTLRTGDIIIAGPAWGKVRAMSDELGRPLGSAGPSTPVEVLGLNEVPSAGDQVHAVKDAKTAEEIAETRKKKANKSLVPPDAGMSLEAIKERLSRGEQLELKLIIKGDVQGSVEAVGSALVKLNTPKVKVTVVHAGVGAITEGDVNLAIASKALIVGFNVRPAGKANALAEGGGIEIRLYNIIYNAVDDIKAAMEGLLPTTKVEKALGTAEVRQVFKITKVGVVAGCYVTSGLVRRSADARLVRDGIVVYTGKISTLRRIKDDAKEVAEGLECGITLENYQDIKDKDIIEAFEIEEVKQKLS